MGFIGFLHTAELLRCCFVAVPRFLAIKEPTGPEAHLLRWMRYMKSKHTTSNKEGEAEDC